MYINRYSITRSKYKLSTWKECIYTVSNPSLVVTWITPSKLNWKIITMEIYGGFISQWSVYKSSDFKPASVHPFFQDKQAKCSFMHRYCTAVSVYKWSANLCIIYTHYTFVVIRKAIFIRRITGEKKHTHLSFEAKISCAKRWITFPQVSHGCFFNRLLKYKLIDSSRCHNVSSVPIFNTNLRVM